MEWLYTLLIVIGLFIVFAVVIMTIYKKINAKQLKSEECKKDGEKWLRLMKIFYSPYSREIEARAKAEGASSKTACLGMAIELEKKYSTNSEIPLAWRDEELVKLIDAFDSHTKTVPSTDNIENKSDEFNTKGAIIGGALGGITGAYIGSHIKKKDDK